MPWGERIRDEIVGIGYDSIDPCRARCRAREKRKKERRERERGPVGEDAGPVLGLLGWAGSDGCPFLFFFKQSFFFPFHFSGFKT